MKRTGLTRNTGGKRAADKAEFPMKQVDIGRLQWGSWAYIELAVAYLNKK